MTRKEIQSMVSSSSLAGYLSGAQAYNVCMAGLSAQQPADRSPQKLILSSLHRSADGPRCAIDPGSAPTRRLRHRPARIFLTVKARVVGKNRLSRSLYDDGMTVARFLSNDDHPSI